MNRLKAVLKRMAPITLSEATALANKVLMAAFTDNDDVRRLVLYRRAHQDGYYTDVIDGVSLIVWDDQDNQHWPKPTD